MNNRKGLSVHAENNCKIAQLYPHHPHLKKGPSLISEPHQQTMAYKPT